MTSIDVVLVSSLVTLGAYLTPNPSVFIVSFQRETVS